MTKMWWLRAEGVKIWPVWRCNHMLECIVYNLYILLWKFFKKIENSRNTGTCRYPWVYLSNQKLKPGSSRICAGRYLNLQVTFVDLHPRSALEVLQEVEMDYRLYECLSEPWKMYEVRIRVWVCNIVKTMGGPELRVTWYRGPGCNPQNSRRGFNLCVAPSYRNWSSLGISECRSARME